MPADMLANMYHLYIDEVSKIYIIVVFVNTVIMYLGVAYYGIGVFVFSIYKHAAKRSIASPTVVGAGDCQFEEVPGVYSISLTH